MTEKINIQIKLLPDRHADGSPRNGVAIFAVTPSGEYIPLGRRANATEATDAVNQYMKTGTPFKKFCLDAVVANATLVID